jgi:tetratricopeptide (TPR) repeat protein
LAHVTLLALNRLARREALVMIRRLTGGKPLPSAVVEQLADRTDGVPLFVEELTKAVLESGLLREEPDRYVLTAPLPPLAIPTTLQASLLARLDRLPGVKDTAQTAAAIGREFAYPLIAALAALPEVKLRQGLDQLVEAGLIFRRGAPPNASYTFKHALVQDAAYGSLLKSRRRQLHRRIARALETLIPKAAEAEPQVLARHYTQAGLWKEAARDWERAGRRALTRSAQAEAVAHLREALEMLGNLPAGPKRDERELGLLLLLGQALFGAGVGTVPEIEAIFTRAKQLALPNAPDAWRRASYGMYIADMIAGRLHRVLDTGRELLCVAERADDDESRVAAERIFGAGCALTGDLLSAEVHLGRAIEITRRSPAWGARDAAFVHSPGQTAPVTLAHVRWSLGFPDKARHLAQGALRAIDQQSEANTAGYMMGWAGLLGLLMREPETAMDHARDLITFAAERGSRYWQTAAEWIKGAALVELGHPEDGLAILAPAFGRFAAMGGKLHEPLARCFETQAYLRLGRPQDGEASLERARQCLADTNQRFYEPGVLLGSAALLRHQGKDGEAEASLSNAIDLARDQQSKSWELRAATSLAELWRDQGRSAEARALLAPVCAWFTEGFGRRDLKEAKALLEELV